MAASTDSRHADSGDQSVGLGPVALMQKCRVYRGDTDALVEVPTQPVEQKMDFFVTESGEIRLSDVLDAYVEDNPGDADESTSAVSAVVFTGDDFVAGVDWGALSLTAAGIATVNQPRRVFTGDTTPTALKLLRTWASEQVTLRGIQCEALQLVVSELATNVERYAPGWLMIDLVFYQGKLLVAVTDRGTDALPQLGQSNVIDASGRGLWIVAAMSAAWGVVRRENSKTVWSLLPCEGDGEGQAEIALVHRG